MNKNLMIVTVNVTITVAVIEIEVVLIIGKELWTFENMTGNFVIHLCISRDIITSNILAFVLGLISTNSTAAIIIIIVVVNSTLSSIEEGLSIGKVEEIVKHSAGLSKEVSI